jgi:hypothetical protein
MSNSLWFEDIVTPGISIAFGGRKANEPVGLDGARRVEKSEDPQQCSLIWKEARSSMIHSSAGQV